MSAPILFAAVTKLSAVAIERWAYSFRRHAPPDARIILLCEPVADYGMLETRYAVELRPAKLWRDLEDQHSVMKDRWDAIGQAMGDVPSDAKVLVTDTRDCVFQRDPFEQMVGDDKLFLASTGQTHAENKWGRELLQLWFSLEGQHLLRNQPALCSGVWGASSAALGRRLSADVWSSMFDIRDGIADQHAMNLVIRRKYQKQLLLMPYADGWCCHCALMYSKQQFGPRTEMKPEQRDGVMYAGEKPFAVVHHVWPDYWPEHAELQRIPSRELSESELNLLQTGA